MWARPAIVAVGSIVLLWLSLAVSAANGLGRLHPELGLRLWPNEGFAQAAMAARELSQGSVPPSVVRARALRSFETEPASIAAVALLAMLSERQDQMHARFDYARRLSRRDLSTNLYFIEEAVRRDDVPGALEQYDVALRTSSDLGPRLLFPILDNALAQPGMAPPIGDLLARGSIWVPEFLVYSIGRGANLRFLAQALAHRPEALAFMPPDAAARFLGELVDQELFELARRLHRHLDPHRHRLDRVRHGDFASAGDWPPFGWALNATGEYGGSIHPGEGVLRLFAEGGAGGIAARQLLRLPPGSYRLATRARIVPGAGAGRAAWSLSCAAPGRPPLASLPIGGRDGGARAATAAVPADCPWQWLAVEVTPEAAEGRFEAHVEEVGIEPA